MKTTDKAKLAFASLLTVAGFGLGAAGMPVHKDTVHMLDTIGFGNTQHEQRVVDGQLAASFAFLAMPLLLCGIACGVAPRRELGTVEQSNKMLRRTLG